MKKLFLRFTAVFMSICLILPLAAVNGLYAEAAEVLPAVQAEVWKRTDIILNSGKEYQNPYLDVEIDAVFTHSDGTRINLYGFWNGDDEWRVRFSPTKTGTWTYTITCSDTGNKGLHNVTGTVKAIPNSGDTDLDKHGFVRISDNGRYFTYDDGTPFYWLGDTQWQAPNYVSTTKCNYPGCNCQNQFKHEVDDRLDKGFTVFQTYFDSGENDGGGQLGSTEEPSLWTSKYEMINPDTFTDKIDGMFDYLADNGMVIALGYGVHSHSTNGMGQEVIEQVSRYLTARYASYPVVWITAQEITGEPHYNTWKASAEVVDAGDGYNHPQGAHMFPMANNTAYTEDLDQQSWHEWWGLQNGHGPIQQSKEFYKSYWDNENVKPYLELEANYEDITCGGFNGYDASRISAWRTNLLGSYGFTYGVTGIWANGYSTTADMGWYQSFSFEPWYMGLDKPGSDEMTYLRKFFEYVHFNELIPRFNDTEYSNCTAENKVVASTEDAATYVAYFYNKSIGSGRLYGLDPDQTYSARWYNPLTGKFIEAEEGITAPDGTYQIPVKPTTGDWAFLLTSKDLGEYETESAYNDPYIEISKNLAIDAAATASSDNSKSGNFGPASAVDGDYDTYWCADSGEMPQWLEIDMGEAKQFKEINVLMHRGNTTRTEKVSYTLQGSTDGETWNDIYSVTDERPTVVGNKDRLRIRAEGSCRYLRLEFGDITSNWATVYELEVLAEESSDDEDEQPINLALDGEAEVSSNSEGGTNGYKAIDGNFSSWWCASGESMPQTLILDMKEAKEFNDVNIYMYGGTDGVSYTIEGSDDKNNWDILYSGTRETPVQVENTVKLNAIAEGTYRYLKIEFTELTGNWATIVELEVYNNSDAGEPGDDQAPEYEGVIQTPLVKSVGTAVYDEQGNYSNTDSNLFDGDPDTEWIPFGPIGSQTILMDMLQENTLQGMIIKPGNGSYLPEYRIEGSNNGSDWTILTDATLRGAQQYQVDGQTAVYETLSGTYRYVKLLWLNAPGNQVKKNIAEISLYADQATPAHPEPAVTDELQTLYGEWKNRNNSEKIYTNTSWKTLQNALAEAGRLLTDPYAAAADIQEVQAALESAVAGLTEQGQKDQLTELLEEAEKKQQNTYTPESWAEFEAALERVRDIIADYDADQDAVQEAYDALERAAQNLVERSTETESESETQPETQPETEKKPDQKIKVSSIKVNKTSAQLFIKDTLKLTATVAPANASDKRVVWSSSNSSVAGVDSSGKVTAKKKGTATITAKAADGSGKTASCTIKVIKATVKLNTKSAPLQVKKTTKAIKASGLQKGDKVISWTSSRKSVATVDKKGRIKAKKAGTTKITVKTKKGAKATMKLKVTKAAVKTKSIKSADKKVALKKGKSYQLKITRNPVTATEKITYKTSNKKIATVSKKGKIKAKKKGRATITVKTSNGKTCKIKVTVK